MPKFLVSIIREWIIEVEAQNSRDAEETAKDVSDEEYADNIEITIERVEE